MPSGCHASHWSMLCACAHMAAPRFRLILQARHAQNLLPALATALHLAPHSEQELGADQCMCEWHMRPQDDSLLLQCNCLVLVTTRQPHDTVAGTQPPTHCTTLHFLHHAPSALLICCILSLTSATRLSMVLCSTAFHAWFSCFLQPLVVVARLPIIF
jgi:hypothetical protein